MFNVEQKQTVDNITDRIVDSEKEHASLKITDDSTHNDLDDKSGCNETSQVKEQSGRRNLMLNIS